MLWAVVAARNGESVPEASLGRQTASYSPSVPKELEPYYWLAASEVAEAMRRYKEAKAYLVQVKDPELVDIALEREFRLDRLTKDFARAYEIGKRQYDKDSPDKRFDRLMTLYGVAKEGHLWRFGSDLMKKAQSLKMVEKDQARFYALEGRANYELSRCHLSIQSYKMALTMGLPDNDGAEARFRLGKCLVKEKKREEARQVWQEVVGMKDAFWSPMAQSEIKVLTP